MESNVKKEAEENSLLKRENDFLKKEVEELTIQLNNKTAHIEQLMESERNLKSELSKYKRSISYRIHRTNTAAFNKLCKTVRYMFPLYTRRRHYIGVILRAIRHPFRTIKNTSGSVIKEGFEHFIHWEEYIANIKGMAEMEQCFIETEIPQPDLKEVKSIEECELIEFERYENPEVSIIIPVYNQFTYTYWCLDSINKNSGEIKYEIILADDCSTDLTAQIEQVVKNIKVIKTETNLRFLKNCNNAAKYARGKYILFLNNDTQVQKNWLEPLVTLMENDISIGMTGSKLVYADGRMLQEAGGIVWQNGIAWNYGNRQNASAPEFNYVKDVDYISGASLMIRTQLWKEIGGFDERFAPAYCEDSDLAFEVRKHGYRVVYQPLSVVIHYEGVSNGTDVTSGLKKYQMENLEKLKEKWKDELQQQYPLETHLFRARERSKEKKIVLFIDHYVPHFDEDAGSKTIYQYLQMFVRKGYVVKFIGDNFYQHEPYTTVLQQMGIEVLYGAYYAKHIFEWLAKNKFEINYVFLNRPHISIKYIDFFREKTAIKTIYYGHDLHFLRNQREYELTGDEQKKKEAEEWKQKELYLMRKADISYYPSYIEEEEIHKIDSKISVRAITAYVYDEFKTDLQTDFSQRNGLLFVGGFRHTPNVDAVIWFAREVFPIIRQQLDVPFYIVGSHATKEILDLDGKDGVIVKGYVSDQELSELYEKCRIDVVPLRYGAGVKGKVVEALYNGIPIVTTSVGAEGIKAADKAMLIYDDAQNFADETVRLYNNIEKLQMLQAETQKLIRNNFSTEAVWNIIKDDF